MHICNVRVPTHIYKINKRSGFFILFSDNDFCTKNVYLIHCNLSLSGRTAEWNPK
jgi:hypothetical protein